MLAASSASALPSFHFHQNDAAYSTSVSPALKLLTVVGSGSFVTPSDVITHYVAGTLTSLVLNARGEGGIKDDRWKHKKFEKADERPAELQEPPTAWVFGAGLALMIVLVLLRRRHTN